MESNSTTTSYVEVSKLDFTKTKELINIHGHYYDLSNFQQEEMLRIEKEYSNYEKMPIDPLHPFFYHIYSNTLPPE